MEVHLDEPADPRIGVYLGLRDHALRQRRERAGGDLDGVFVAEGEVVIGRALRAGYSPTSALVDATRNRPLPPSWPPGVPVYRAGPEVLEAVTGRPRHRAPLACFARRPVPPPRVALAGAQRVVVLENVVNPTNVGVISRSAVALGADALVLDPTSADPLYRRTSRVAMGEGFALPHTWAEAFPAGLAVLAELGFTVLALTPAPDATSLRQLGRTLGDRIAVVLGAEGHGLTEATLARVDLRVRIPLRADVDSLNVGAAAAVAFYELFAR